MTLSKEFKQALSDLPSKEKDKLIIRLLRRDIPLTKRLEFELVSIKSVEESRVDVMKSLEIGIEKSAETFYSCGYLNMELRYLSGEINEHVSITKDKYGEVKLHLYLLTEILAQNKKNILVSTSSSSYKFCLAVVARAFKILLLLNKTHEDHFVDFRADLERLGEVILENDYIMKVAIHNGLDVNWLLSSDIPEEIQFIYKELRANGFL